MIATTTTLDSATKVCRVSMETGYEWVQMPADYEADLVTAEDCVHDDAIVVLTGARHGWLVDYRTGEDIRPATEDEADESIRVEGTDNGVFEIEGHAVYVR